MSAMTMTLDLHAPRFAWREHGVALGAAVALHLGLAVVLLNLSHTSPLPPAISVVMTTELVTLPAPVVQPPAPPVPTQPIISPPAAPQPMVAAPPVEQADLAFKRVEQQRQQEKARQLKREQQQRIEETRRQEQVARETQQRQALEREQQLAQAQAQARQTEADSQAAAARAQAEAEAANSQYLPIAKEAPDYPQRALDRKIEGECTVAYRVNAQGRVEDPQVLGECHPLFVKPSLAAAKTFRYQPKIVNGQAVAVASVKNTFSFKIR